MFKLNIFEQMFDLREFFKYYNGTDVAKISSKR